ncbi:hypothetical protein, partial [Nitrosomonas sp. Nm132]|uniref:hypothetical protein n=1 Tax=Nitrosomonas sp. Nm132 TaxID=1881053 RepID=UPI001C40AB4A
CLTAYFCISSPGTCNRLIYICSLECFKNEGCSEIRLSEAEVGRAQESQRTASVCYRELRSGAHRKSGRRVDDFAHCGGCTILAAFLFMNAI